MKHYNKLVRDSVPGMLRGNGHQVDTRTIQGDELLAALRAKIDEEVAEYDAATDDERAAAELADLIEVIVALAKRRGYDEAKLNELRAQKASQRGTFDRGLFLESVE
ncbi:MAG TPA: nucleoside triphosphate pyrophosphohydrolase [Candidatus Limnocylindrales bacterium]|jgi:Uncharacterized conserved protein|nr:nucleoside triphosphate pyrophosphohydrolase [Candidatus Limnocylindrales bacterium]